MSDDRLPTLQELDRDGAIRESAARVEPSTRAAFLRRALAVTGGAVAASAALPAASALAQGGGSKGDAAILNYALTLEYLEAAFYRDALDKGALKGELAHYATVVAGHEAAHVKALQTALGSNATKQPMFDFKGTTASAATFSKTAKTLEDTGVEAYQGQVTNIKAKKILTAAVSIHPVEARHAAWIAAIIGGDPSPAPKAFNPAADMQTVLGIVKSTGFISSSMGKASPGSGVSAQPKMTG